MIPSLSFKSQNLVIVNEGSYERFSYNDMELDLWGAFQELEGFDKIYFLDIDGIEYNRPQTDIIRKASTTKEVWADIGARTAEGITDAFIAGADKAVLSTKTVESFEEIERSIELSDDLILCLDYQEGLISPSNEIRDMGVGDLTTSCVKKGIEKVVFNDLSDKPFDEKGLRKMPRGDYQLYLGGISLDRVDYVDHGNLQDFILKFREAVKYQES
ncbi:MAG: HisA/HisF-related TIM barrel protein [Candidatus Thermoplasmatota archaeon]